jgi:hypothetical protein
MYCKSCAYNLCGNVTPKCPECGRGFEPDDDSTYSPTARIRDENFLSRYTVCFLVGAGLVITAQLILTLALEGRNVLDWSFVIKQALWVLPVVVAMELLISLRGCLFQLRLPTLAVMASILVLFIWLTFQTPIQMLFGSGKMLAVYGFPAFLTVLKGPGGQVTQVWQVSGLIDSIYLGVGTLLMAAIISDTAIEIRLKLRKPQQSINTPVLGTD